MTFLSFDLRLDSLLEDILLVLIFVGMCFVWAVTLSFPSIFVHKEILILGGASLFWISNLVEFFFGEGLVDVGLEISVGQGEGEEKAQTNKNFHGYCNL